MRTAGRLTCRSGAASALLIGLSLLVLVGCDDEKAEKAKKQSAASAAAEQAEAHLLADPVRSTIEFKRRLREKVKFRDGLITVDDQFGLSQFVLPANAAPWVINCGMGIRVVFGNAGAADDAASLTLSFGLVEKDQCAILGLALGKEIQAILAGQ